MQIFQKNFTHTFFRSNDTRIALGSKTFQTFCKITIFGTPYCSHPQTSLSQQYIHSLHRTEVPSAENNATHLRNLAAAPPTSAALSDTSSIPSILDWPGESPSLIILVTKSDVLVPLVFQKTPPPAK